MVQRVMSDGGEGERRGGGGGSRQLTVTVAWATVGGRIRPLVMKYFPF